MPMLFDIIEEPTNNDIRIIGTDVLYSHPQQTGEVIYDSIIDEKLSHIHGR